VPPGADPSRNANESSAPNGGPPGAPHAGIHVRSTVGAPKGDHPGAHEGLPTGTHLANQVIPHEARHERSLGTTPGRFHGGDPVEPPGRPGMAPHRGDPEAPRLRTPMGTPVGEVK